MTAQRHFFSRGSILKAARQTWIDQTLEKTIVKVIREGLVCCRIPHWVILARTPCPTCGKWAAEPPDKGIADIAGIVPAFLCSLAAPWGRPLFIEVKRPKGGRMGFEQKLFLEAQRKEGAIAFFARTWEECARELRAAGVKLPAGI